MDVKNKRLDYKGYTVFGKERLPLFDRIPKVYKENEACFMFINEGEISLRSAEEYIDFKPNQALLAKCLNYFFEISDSQKENNEAVEIVAVILYPAIVEELFEFDINNSDFELDFNVKQMEVDKLLANFRESIDLLLENPELADENLIKTKIKEFVLLMTKKNELPSELEFLSGIFKTNEVDFKKGVINNIYSNLSLEELASLNHMSLSTFKRKFKEVFNDTPKKYITKKKLEKARDILSTGKHRIADVAFDLGFESIATFNRNFTNHFNKKPSDYRLTQNEK